MANWPIATTPILMTEKATALLLSVSFRTLQSWRQTDRGPPYLKIGRAIRYEREALLAWIELQRELP